MPRPLGAPAPPFGSWLRAQRQARDLTQGQLAAALGCSANLIHKLEAGERRPSRQVAELLATVLQVPGAGTPAFVAWARGLPGAAQYQPPGAASAGGPSSPFDARPLPIPPTSFVGRAAEIAAVAGLLRRPAVRLVTLTGPPGVGKTRLALEVAARLQAEFAGGSCFVDLTPVREPPLLPAAILEALSAPEPAGGAPLIALRAALRPVQLLLVLDNFEQILAAAPLVADLLLSAPALKVLATSRAALRLRGEKEVGVPPLALPDPDRPLPPAALAEVEAVALFAGRAADLVPGFAVTEANAAPLAAICTQLDGLPLAIELAAGRSKLFPLAALLAQLDHRLAVLTAGPRDLPARQQTLRATLAWSYDLLPPAAQRLFAYLAVFAGGWTLPALAAVCALSPAPAAPDDPQPVANSTLITQNSELVDALGILVESNLVQPADSIAGVPRFQMLQTIQEFAAERLAADPEAPAVYARHAAYFLALAAEAGPQLFGPAQSAWLDRLDMEHANLREVLRRALDGDNLVTTARLGIALWRFWWVRGHVAEGRRWLDALRPRAAALPVELRIDMLRAGGTFARTQLDFSAAHALAEESLALAQAQGNILATQRALNSLGLLAWTEGDYPRARALLTATLADMRAAGSSDLEAGVLSNLAMVARADGAYGEARDHGEAALALNRARGNMWGVGVTLSTLALVLDRRDARDAARAALAEGVAVFQTLGSDWGLALCLVRRAAALAARGEWERAARLYGAAEPLFRRTGTRMEVLDATEYAQHRAAAQAAGAGDRWGAAEAAGWILPVDAALALALDEF